jgi:hypothetical protein
MKSTHSYSACAVTLALSAQHLFCAENFDWPQWQGPDRNAISRETGLLKEWPKEGPPLAWKIKGLGGGDSTPSIAAVRIYGMGRRGRDEFVWALSEKDGKEIWAVPIAPAHSTSWPQSKEGPIVLIEPVVIGVHRRRQPELAHIVEAPDAFAGFLGSCQCRQQHCGENPDDANHNEQLNECECCPFPV